MFVARCAGRLLTTDWIGLQHEVKCTSHAPLYHPRESQDRRRRRRGRRHDGRIVCSRNGIAAGALASCPTPIRLRSGKPPGPLQAGRGRAAGPRRTPAPPPACRAAVIKRRARAATPALRPTGYPMIPSAQCRASGKNMQSPAGGRLDSAPQLCWNSLKQRWTMKWIRERDALIAQTLAFVQSVTGKKDDLHPPEPLTAFTLTTEIVTVQALAVEAEPQPARPAPEPAPLPAPAAVHGRLPQRDAGPNREFQEASGALRARARGILCRDPDQAPRCHPRSLRPPAGGQVRRT